ncbi:MAG: hypothetical protein SFV19_00110 [Rhodospirillaceae bacterium]|nr:hypothetical protein [Rhodospirillaceae bacterium]
MTAPSTDIVLPDTQSLAVRREAIQGPFERSPFRLSFEFKSLSDGRSRMIGRSADGMTQLELVGPPEALTGALLKAQMPDDNKLAQVKNLNALVNLARLAAPEWINAEAWVTDNIPTAFQDGRVTTSVEGRRVAMSALANTKTLILTITGPEL